MKNIERIVKMISQTGTKNVLIHVVPRNGNWVIGQKNKEKDWLMTLGHPSGHIMYNLGKINQEAHTDLWEILIRKKIDNYSVQDEIKRITAERTRNLKVTM